MPLLKRLNSVVFSNCSGVKPPSGGGCVSLGFVSCRSAMRHRSSGQLLISESVPNNASHANDEAFLVSQFSIVVPKSLLVEITEQMKWLDTHVGSANGSLQETPEVFESVRVARSVNVCFRVVDNLVGILGVQPIVGLQRIGVESSALRYVIPDLGLKVMLAPKVYDGRANLASLSFKQTEHNSLTNWAASGYLCRSFVRVHVAGFTADKGFIRFDRTSHLVDMAFMLRKANPMQHKPSRFLGHSERSVKLIGTDPVLAIEQHPSSRQPLFQRYRGVFVNGPCFECERRALVPTVALPNTLLRKPRNLFSAALRAFNFAVWPAKLHHELATMLEIREVQDRVPERCMWRTHGSSMRSFLWNVKYIIALFRDMLTFRCNEIQLFRSFDGTDHMAPARRSLFDVRHKPAFVLAGLPTSVA